MSCWLPPRAPRARRAGCWHLRRAKSRLRELAAAVRRPRRKSDTCATEPRSTLPARSTILDLSALAPPTPWARPPWRARIALLHVLRQGGPQGQEGRGQPRARGLIRGDRERPAPRPLAARRQSRTLHASGLELNEVARDGCFYRSLSDQLDHTDGPPHGVPPARRRVHEGARRRLRAAPRPSARATRRTTLGRGVHGADEQRRRVGRPAGAARRRPRAARAHHRPPVGRAGGESSRRRRRRPRRSTSSYHDGEHYNSVRVLGGSGARAARGAASAPAAAPASEDEKPLMASSGCTDVAAARRALDKSGGDLDAALERLQLDAMDGGDGDGSGGGGGATRGRRHRRRGGGGRRRRRRGGGRRRRRLDDAKARREKKATRKEEKRAAKEQRHREAAARAPPAAAAADDDDAAAAPAAGPIDRGGVITLGVYVRYVGANPLLAREVDDGHLPPRLRVRLRALAAARQPVRVAEAAVRADVDQPLDVLGGVLAQRGARPRARPRRTRRTSRSPSAGCTRAATRASARAGSGRAAPPPPAAAWRARARGARHRGERELGGPPGVHRVLLHAERRRLAAPPLSSLSCSTNGCRRGGATVGRAA